MPYLWLNNFFDLAAIPSLLNLQTAAIAAAIAVPSLLLLYFLKLRRREISVPSTLLWKKAIQDLQVNSPFQRLRKNLLLLLQMLLLFLLVLALARPVMNYSPGAGSLAVICVDRSASMAARDVEGKSRLEEAKRQARDLVDSLDKNGSAMVIAFDDGAEIVSAFATDHGVLKQAIDSIQLTDRRSKLETAFQLAEAKALAFNPDQNRTNQPRPGVWLFSDGRVLDRAELALKYAELKEYRKIGSDTAPNIGIVALNAKRNYERPTDVQVFARLANFGPEPRNAVVQMSVDGTIAGVRRDLMLLPERWTQQQREKAEKDQKLVAKDSVEFNLEMLKAGVVKVEIKERGDDLLAADDSAQVVVPPPRSLKVMLVTAKGNFWLEKFLSSANLKEPVTVAPQGYEDKMKDPQAFAAEFDVIIFDRYQPKTLPPAGNFIYFKTVPPNSKIKEFADANGVVTTLKDEIVLDWERTHPMLRFLNMKFLATESMKLQVPIDAQVLVEGRQGPLVVLHRDGRATHLVISFDVQESTWPTTRSFPVFLDNALQYLALGSEMDIRPSYQPGATPRIPRYNLQAAGQKQIRIAGPDGFKAQTVAIPESGDFALPALDKVGVYALDPPIPQFEKLAVNLLDENESNLLPVIQAPGGDGKVVGTTSTGKSRLELWWWIVACAAIPLCLVEWWVYTRRVHL